MARLTFKQGEQQYLRGTFCGLIYRTFCGTQHAHIQLPAPLPEHPSAKDLERHRKQQVVMWAVGSIQMMLFEQSADKSIQRMQQLADQYDTFRHEAVRKYSKWQHLFRDDKRFARAIAYWYVTGKYPPQFPKLFTPSSSSRASGVSAKFPPLSSTAARDAGSPKSFARMGCSVSAQPP